MADAWSEEAFEREELQQFLTLLSGPEAVAHYKKVRDILYGNQAEQEREWRLRQHRANRHMIFVKLVELLGLGLCRAAPEQFPATWLPTVVNNSYAVTVPEQEANILQLSYDYIDWYVGAKSRPAWVPAVLDFHDRRELPCALFPYDGV